MLKSKTLVRAPFNLITSNVPKVNDGNSSYAHKKGTIEGLDHINQVQTRSLRNKTMIYVCKIILEDVINQHIYVVKVRQKKESQMLMKLKISLHD